MNDIKNIKNDSLMLNKQHLNGDQIQDLCQQILAETKRQGADQAEVNISTNKGFSVAARNLEVEKIEYHQDKIIEITVYKNKHCGAVSISDLSMDAIQSAVRAACHIAQFTDADVAAGLAEKEELAFHYPSLTLAHPWSISVEEAISLACECEREALAYDKSISTEDISVGTANMIHAYANSQGFLGYYPHTRHEISCVLVAKKNKDMQRDYQYTVSADPSQLTSVGELARQAASKTLRRLGARRLATMKVPVIFIAEEARSLLGHFVAAISGSQIYRKSSFLLDHLDQQIFPSFVELKEYPHLPNGLGSAPFDDDGVATRSNIFIEEGILRQYALGVYSARKLNMRTTGNAGGIHNLCIKPHDLSLTELLKKMDKGLLITEMMGQGVHLLTGDYSRGVGGYWVENGEIQYPVQEITVAGRLQDMYRHMVAVANDIDVRGNIRTGSILIEEMMIAGE